MTSDQSLSSGPCEAARRNVETRCAEAERLAAAAADAEQRVTGNRRELAAVAAQREADARVRDRRELAAAKEAARATYRTALSRAADDGAVERAAGAWLEEISELNRRSRLASQRGNALVQRSTDLERSLPGLELAADAARIAAAAAAAACLDARQALAECEEKAQQSAPRPSRPSSVPPGMRPISLLLRGDRPRLIELCAELAAETGVEPGRLQLLLLELREQIFSRALAENVLRFPEEHPFWGQFSTADGRRVSAALAGLGYRFDGRSSWIDGRAPSMRELAVAIGHAGLDPRLLRRPPTQEAVAGMWRGTFVMAEEFLGTRAPTLDLERVVASLGPGATRLTELWDMWGRLRIPLLTPAAETPG